MLRSSRPWQWLPVALMLAGCAVPPSGAVVPSAPPFAGSSLRVPGGPGCAEYPNLPTIPEQIASDLTGKERKETATSRPRDDVHDPLDAKRGRPNSGGPPPRRSWLGHQ